MIVSEKQARAALATMLEHLSTEELIELGVAPGMQVTEAVANAMYRRAAKRTHPDAGGSMEAFAAVDRAKHVLVLFAQRTATVPHPATAKPCHRCEGRGFIARQKGFKSMRVTCAACRGSGEEGVEIDERSDI